MIPDTTGQVDSNISHERYLQVGGIINKDDYRIAMETEGQKIKHINCFVSQAKSIALRLGFTEDISQEQLDKVAMLYGVLRSDIRPGSEYHHGQMCDQRLFAEALRMLDHEKLLIKVINAFPNISF